MLVGDQHALLPAMVLSLFDPLTPPPIFFFKKLLCGRSSVAFGSSCLGSSKFTLNLQETLERARGVISAEAC